MSLTKVRHDNAVRGAAATRRIARTQGPAINWDERIANLKAMLNQLDRKYRQ